MHGDRPVRLFCAASRPLLMANDTPGERDPCLAAMRCYAAAAWSCTTCCSVPPRHRRVRRIAMQLATCADDFLGRLLRDWSRSTGERRREGECRIAPLVPARPCRPTPAPFIAATVVRLTAQHARSIDSGGRHVHQRPLTSIHAQAYSPLVRRTRAPDDRQAAANVEIDD